MLERNFHSIIRWRRRSLRLKQREVARRAGMSPQRLCQLEHGQKRPTPKECGSLSQVLQLDLHTLLNAPARPRAFERRLLQAGYLAAGTPPPYYPPADRSAVVRCRALGFRFPGLTKEARRRLRMKRDYHDILFFCESLSLGSADECLYVLVRILEGARPALVAPSRLGRLPHAVVCPESKERVGHRPFPCLIHGDGLEFFQVSLEAGYTVTIDVLRFSEGWSVVEIDGEGHRSAGDTERERRLNLSTIRLTTRSLVERAEALLHQDADERTSHRPAV